MVFTTGQEALTYQKLDMTSCVYRKRSIQTTNPCIQTEQEQNNMTVIVRCRNNSQAS